jgi:hypothetical protein
LGQLRRRDHRPEGSAEPGLSADFALSRAFSALLRLAFGEPKASADGLSLGLFLAALWAALVPISLESLALT